MFQEISFKVQIDSLAHAFGRGLLSDGRQTQIFTYFTFGLTTTMTSTIDRLELECLARIALNSLVVHRFFVFSAKKYERSAM